MRLRLKQFPVKTYLLKMKHRLFIAFILFEFALISGLFLRGASEINLRKGEIHDKKQLVAKLQLTDFAIWTEARYTRHPSQADLFTPFQDFPSSMEHFPAGSIMSPPPRTETTAFKSKKK